MTDAQNQIIGLLKEIKAAAGGGAAAVWGAITGTLSNQTDLQTALNLKQTAAQVQALIDAATGALPVLASGTYTPTVSGAVNLDADPTMSACQYLRVGNVVTVSGKFGATPTVAITTTSFRIDLPIASAINNDYEVAGVATSDLLSDPVAIKGNNSDVKFQWRSESDVPNDYWFSFTYQIIS